MRVLAGLLVFAILAPSSAIAGLEFEPLARLTPWSAPNPWDLAANLVDELKYTTLEQMRAARLEEAKLKNKPWSGWFYPLNNGGLAYRYADPNFPKNKNWSTTEQYILDTMGKSSTVNLSPSEKYDLMLGDTDYTLTRNTLQIATNHAVGDVIDGWMGYCTGWANASMSLPRPLHSVTVLAPDRKTRVQFRPSDIKALAALLWANGSFPTRLVGTLCQQSPVERDPSNDRPYDPACQDTNPATWHLSVVNQIGVSQRSFLIDSDPGSQVWNQPVYGYSYTYFNPQTGQPTPFEAARVALRDLTKDKFAAYRAPETESVIGVEMKLTFVYEKEPDVGFTDSPATDEVRTPVYKYDLELDRDDKIIGGEWWSRIHPDVLWVAWPGKTPITWGDAQLAGDESMWNLKEPIPDPWVDAARISEKYLQPLPRIVDQLVRWSAQ